MSEGLRAEASSFVPRATASAWQPPSSASAPSAAPTTTTTEAEKNNHHQYAMSENAVSFYPSSTTAAAATATTTTTADPSSSAYYNHDYQTHHNELSQLNEANVGVEPEQYHHQQPLKPMFFNYPTYYPCATATATTNENNENVNDESNNQHQHQQLKVTFVPPAPAKTTEKDENEEEDKQEKQYPLSTTLQPGTYILMSDGESYQWFDREDAKNFGFDLDHYIYHQQISQLAGAGIGVSAENKIGHEEFDYLWQDYEKRKEEEREAQLGQAEQNNEAPPPNFDFYDPSENSAFYYYNNHHSNPNPNSSSYDYNNYGQNSVDHDQTYNNHQHQHDQYYPQHNSFKHRGGGGRGRGGRGGRGGAHQQNQRGRGGRGRGSHHAGNNTNSNSSSTEKPNKTGFYFDGKKYYDIDFLLHQRPEKLDEDEKTFVERYRRIQASKEARKLIATELGVEEKEVDEKNPEIKKRERQLYYECFNRNKEELEKKFAEEDRLAAEKLREEEERKARLEEEQRLQEEERKEKLRVRRAAKRKRTKLRKQALKVAEAVAAGTLKFDDGEFDLSDNDDDDDDDHSTSSSNSDSSSADDSSDDSDSEKKQKNKNNKKKKKNKSSSSTAQQQGSKLIKVPNQEGVGNATTEVSRELLEQISKRVQFKKNADGKLVPVLDTSTQAINELLPQELRDQLTVIEASERKMQQQQQQQQNSAENGTTSANSYNNHNNNNGPVIAGDGVTLYNNNYYQTNNKYSTSSSLKQTKPRGISIEERYLMVLRESLLRSLQPLVPHCLGNSTNMVMTAIRKSCNEPLLNIHVDQRQSFEFGNTRASTPGEFVVSATCAPVMPWPEKNDNNNTNQTPSSSSVKSFYSSTSSLTTCHFHHLPDDELKKFCHDLTIVLKNQNQNRSKNTTTTTRVISLPFGQKTKTASATPYFFLATVSDSDDNSDSNTNKQSSSSSLSSCHTQIIRNLAVEFIANDEEAKKLKEELHHQDSSSLTPLQSRLNNIIEPNAKEPSCMSSIIATTSNNSNSSSSGTDSSSGILLRDLTPLVFQQPELELFKHYSFEEIVERAGYVVPLSLAVNSDSNNITNHNSNKDEFNQHEKQKQKQSQHALKALRTFLETICHDLFISSVKEYWIDILTSSSSSSSSSSSKFILRTTEAQIKAVSFVSKEGITSVRFTTNNQQSCSSSGDFWTAALFPPSATKTEVQIDARGVNSGDSDDDALLDRLLELDGIERKKYVEPSSRIGVSDTHQEQQQQQQQQQKNDNVISSSSSSSSSSDNNSLYWISSAVMLAGAGVLMMKSLASNK